MCAIDLCRLIIEQAKKNGSFYKLSA